MDNHIQQIAQRLQGLRESLNLTVQEVATRCQLSEERYLALESGTTDLSISTLQIIARSYNIALEVLMFGEEPKMNSYFITRKDHGISVERTKSYQYQSLASGFQNHQAAPFMVTVEPKPEATPLTYNSHPGEEFIHVTEGKLQINIGERELFLHQGDSIYFDSNLQHGMKALEGKRVQFLTVII
ncbi:MAG: helix-turn-helix domain-containing protein [Phocaeicola sp.]